MFSSPFKGRWQPKADEGALKETSSGIKDKDDSLKKIINREARKASIMSACLPGLGQAYNKKWWKIPVIYAALGGVGYFIYTNNSQYQIYHKELLFRYQYQATSNPDLAQYTTDQIVTQKNVVKKYRDTFIIGAGIIYLLNIIDANVDAHLKSFDVSDNLSLSIRPRAFYCLQTKNNLAAGITVALNFKTHKTKYQ